MPNGKKRMVHVQYIWFFFQFIHAKINCRLCQAVWIKSYISCHELSTVSLGWYWYCTFMHTIRFNFVKRTCLFKSTLMFFSLASFFFMSFAWTRLRKSKRQFECLTCSILTLIRFARIRPLKRLVLIRACALSHRGQISVVALLTLLHNRLRASTTQNKWELLQAASQDYFDIT